MSNATLMLLLICVTLGLCWLWERENHLQAEVRHRERMAQIIRERNDAEYERQLLEARIKSLMSHQGDLLRQKEEEYMQEIAKMERKNRTNNVIAAQVFEKAKRRA